MSPENIKGELGKIMIFTLQSLTWSAEGRREELREILMRRSDLHTGGVVAARQTSAMLHHTIQTDNIQKYLNKILPRNETISQTGHF